MNELPHARHVPSGACGDHEFGVAFFLAGHVGGEHERGAAARGLGDSAWTRFGDHHVGGRRRVRGTASVLWLCCRLGFVVAGSLLVAAG
jgi:hypothetical protein